MLSAGGRRWTKRSKKLKRRRRQRRLDGGTKDQGSGSWIKDQVEEEENDKDWWKLAEVNCSWKTQLTWFHEGMSSSFCSFLTKNLSSVRLDKLARLTVIWICQIWQIRRKKQIGRRWHCLTSATNSGYQLSWGFEDLPCHSTSRDILISWIAGTQWVTFLALMSMIVLIIDWSVLSVFIPCLETLSSPTLLL